MCEHNRDWQKIHFVTRKLQNMKNIKKLPLQNVAANQIWMTSDIVKKYKRGRS
jgi:hypothetical protein